MPSRLVGIAKGLAKKDEATMAGCRDLRHSWSAGHGLNIDLFGSLTLTSEGIDRYYWPDRADQCPQGDGTSCLC